MKVNLEINNRISDWICNPGKNTYCLSTNTATLVFLYQKLKPNVTFFTLSKNPLPSNLSILKRENRSQKTKIN